MTIYENKVREYETALAEAEKELKNISTLRLLAFVGSFALIIFLANARLAPLVWLLVPVCMLGFGLLIRNYNKLSYQKKNITFLKEINEQEVLRQQNKLSGFPSGQAFIDRDHPYSADLDMFGPHSLYQLINRATTESGQVLLAEFLTRPASEEIIIQRQHAIKELTPNLDWRQDFQAAGMHFTNSKSGYQKLLTWIEKPATLLPDQLKYMSVSIFLALVSTAAAVYFVFGMMYYMQDFSLQYILPLIISLIINSLYLKKLRPVAEDIIDNTHHNVIILGGYQSLITKIESGHFQSEILQRLKSAFSAGTYSAAHEISGLKNILSVFQMKGSKRSVGKNDFYAIFNILWLFDVHLIILTEKWKQKNGSQLRTWAGSVSEFEVLSSVAGFAYSNPSFTFPEIQKEPYSIHFETLGHPLLNPERRVSNDFDLEGRGEIAMITGSNMAGKSTFLRTVGINLVLALIGAPCCAKSGRVSHMKIFTSMRTQDNLEEGVSSFYAELKRIEQLLKLIESGEPIFFLLDEMFKGTNSEDRYKGGASLIRQLSELNAFGMISTHDLELARLAAKHMIVANFSFNSEINSGEIIFNYRLTKGICTDFNASELMKRSGIRILSDITP
ncbi:MutS-related protein [Dyadobacter bucti]|uniref:MutS-related protein n=1 Tax=Dyadobacter bucti TaxID=2572203 RepID=UPI0011085741|nr:DNA mismatch repair protein MutS [Dyadobacter bucti]